MAASWSEMERAFGALLAKEERKGLLAAVRVSDVELLPEQRAYLQKKLAPLGLPESEITAISLGVAYHVDEIDPIPRAWTGGKGVQERWNAYAHFYHGLNNCLSGISKALAAQFDGVAEGPTREGVAGKVAHVTDYFPTCVSHRAFAETARLGWRGRHQLIVTPEFGPAFRLATVFVPGRIEGPKRDLAGCQECTACLDLCPVLKRGLQKLDMNAYREMCRKRIKGLGLAADVCGQCVRRCWEVVVGEPETQSPKLA